MSDDAALYREALRMACEYFQEPLSDCPNSEDYELADNESHGCYSCKHFSWSWELGRKDGNDAFTEKAVECYMKAFLLKAQKKRDKEVTQIAMWNEAKNENCAL